jgi:hypothetical protein
MTEQTVDVCTKKGGARAKDPRHLQLHLHTVRHCCCQPISAAATHLLSLTVKESTLHKLYAFCLLSSAVAGIYAHMQRCQ